MTSPDGEIVAESTGIIDLNTGELFYADVNTPLKNLVNRSKNSGAAIKKAVKDVKPGELFDLVNDHRPTCIMAIDRRNPDNPQKRAFWMFQAGKEGVELVIPDYSLDRPAYVFEDAVISGRV